MKYIYSKWTCWEFLTLGCFYGNETIDYWQKCKTASFPFKKAFILILHYTAIIRAQKEEWVQHHEKNQQSQIKKKVNWTRISQRYNSSIIPNMMKLFFFLHNIKAIFARKPYMTGRHHIQEIPFLTFVTAQNSTSVYLSMYKLYTITMWVCM